MVHLCSACLQNLPVDEFYILPTGKVDYRCRECKKHNRKSVRRSYISRDTKALDEVRYALHWTDYVAAYKLLEKIGYNLKENIHQQFCEKHNIPFNSVKRKGRSKITPETLNLI